ncbi:MAG: L-threonine 3-dehydrogenase [Treponema sp.]|jgi:threonine 3-dehydrogenase|nr:L-threonine 3-dehydrogenase [Treponema sp.]
MQKMKALVKKFPKPGIWMDEVDRPLVGPDDVLVRIKKTAICGTDIHIYEWNEWAQKTLPVPMTIGHEFVGEIVELGENVKSVKIGDLVSGEGHIVCGFCRNCQAGRRHLCKNSKGVGVNRPGCFAEYLSVPVSNIWRTDPAIPEELYSIFDPYGNAVHTALSFDLIGEDVLITGAGPIGIMAAVVALKVGARHVVITDLNPYRLDLARKMGIKNAFNVKDTNIAEIQAQLNMKEGFDVGMEMSGSGAAFADMIDNMACGGKIALLGLQPSGTVIDWNKVIFHGLRIKGIYGREIFETWYKMAALIKAGLDLSAIITHRYKIDDFQEAFEIMASGNSGKIILDWEA